MELSEITYSLVEKILQLSLNFTESKNQNQEFVYLVDCLRRDSGESQRQYSGVTGIRAKTMQIGKRYQNFLKGICSKPVLMT
jgi:hypothetical protein